MGLPGMFGYGNRATQDDVERQAAQEFVMQIADDRLARFYREMAAIWQPPVWPTLEYIGAAPSATAGATVSRQYSLQGFWRLARLNLMTVDGTYPSRVEVLLPGFSAMPFVLTQTDNELRAMRIPFLGGFQVQITNYDTGHACRVYMEMEQIDYGKASE